MASSAVAKLRRRRHDLVRRLGTADDVPAVFAEASTGLRRVVPFDAAAWVTTDPATGLPSGPTRTENVDHVSAAQCSEHWRREFMVGDVNLFGDLARTERPVAALRATTGDPRRSHRYRTFLRPIGFDDELRAVLRVGDSPWGAVALMRRPGRPPFSAGEIDFVAGLVDPIGEAIRMHARPADPVTGLVRADRPGLMIFDRHGDLLSVNDQAKA
jgi:hypothetical protein